MWYCIFFWSQSTMQIIHLALRYILKEHSPINVKNQISKSILARFQAFKWVFSRNCRSVHPEQDPVKIFSGPLTGPLKAI